jgi:hypothetical protein
MTSWISASDSTFSQAGIADPYRPWRTDRSRSSSVGGVPSRLIESQICRRRNRAGEVSQQRRRGAVAAPGDAVAFDAAFFVHQLAACGAVVRGRRRRRLRGEPAAHQERARRQEEGERDRPGGSVGEPFHEAGLYEKHDLPERSALHDGFVRACRAGQRQLAADHRGERAVAEPCADAAGSLRTALVALNKVMPGARRDAACRASISAPRLPTTRRAAVRGKNRQVLVD